MKRYRWRTLIFFLLVATIVIPIIIHFCSPSVISEITADGMLAYLGNCVTAIPTIIIAAVAICQTNKANKIAEEANKGAERSDEIAKKANEISERLLELEETRQKLEWRPSFDVIDWHTSVKEFAMLKDSEVLSIEVGKCSNQKVWGIELELLNNSSGFETICYKSAKDEQGKTWSNAVVGMKTRKIKLQSFETSKIYFCADKEFWKEWGNRKISLEFYLNNRLDNSYQEKFEMIIMPEQGERADRDDEIHLHLEIQNYNVGKYVGKSEKCLDGVLWEK